MNFRKAITRPDASQDRVLRELLKTNSNTQFGKRYEFSTIGSVKQFQQKVPLSTFTDYQPYIEMIAQGQNSVLTADSVRVFEPSSGSSAASKLIPYTKSLKQQFNRGIAPWMFSLYKTNPGLFNGRAYWSISPAMDREKYKGSVKVGFEDDSDYLGIIGKHFYGKVTAVPAAVSKLTDINQFRNKTLAYLLLAEDLALISVWNPTFLTILLEHLLQNIEQVIKEVQLVCGRHTARAGRVEKLLSKIKTKNDFRTLWPNLAVISCWTDGACSIYADQLYDYFPEVTIQGKGLIATEGFVSLPLDNYTAPVLAVTSHFFEFRDIDNDQIRLAGELEIGRRYLVIISTGGGFYRYQLGDIIEVTGFAERTPMFRFISKETGTVDFFGEKLQESHVAGAIQTVCEGLNFQPSFYLLAPVKNSDATVSYTLFIESADMTPEICRFITERLEKELRENYHYNYCRKLGQLAGLKLFIISSAANETFMQRISETGVKLGDIKPQALSGMTGWERYFDGKFFVA